MGEHVFLPLLLRRKPWVSKCPLPLSLIFDIQPFACPIGSRSRELSLRFLRRLLLAFLIRLGLFLNLVFAMVFACVHLRFIVFIEWTYRVTLMPYSCLPKSESAFF